jgi:hypothetical protein
LECPPKKTQAYARAYEGVYFLYSCTISITYPFGKKVGKKWEKSGKIINEPCRIMSYDTLKKRLKKLANKY